MAYARLGRTSQAAAAFASAAETREHWIESLNAGSVENWPILQGATAQWPIDRLDWLEFEHYFREAAQTLDLPMPAEDARWYVQRARAFAGLRKREKADEAYRRAIALSPEDRSIRYEAHRNRAHYLVKLERYAEAADEFTRAAEFASEDSHLWSCIAIAQLAGGDADAYRRTCNTMFNHFAGATDGHTLYNLIWTCSIAPNALSDLRRLAPIAQAAGNWWIDSDRGLVALNYRLGQYEEALRSFDRLSQVVRPLPATLFFAAMSHQRLGQGAQARQKLAAGSSALATHYDPSTIQFSTINFVARSWQEKVTEPLLRKEAEALILGHSR
jgi:tetratricopeptide (TPR) repeat protein